MSVALAALEAELQSATKELKEISESTAAIRRDGDRAHNQVRAAQEAVHDIERGIEAVKAAEAARLAQQKVGVQ